MNDSTHTKKKDNKLDALKKKLAKPSDNTIMFLQMFARAYTGNVVSAM